MVIEIFKQNNESEATNNSLYCLINQCSTAIIKNITTRSIIYYFYNDDYFYLFFFYDTFLGRNSPIILRV